MSNLLEGLKLIDFSHRLPGPLAGHLLSTFGATVIKIEDKKFGDPFSQGLFGEMDESFSYWYKSLNSTKEVKKFDFNDSSDQDSIKQIVEHSDGIIMGLPEKIQLKLGLSNDYFKSQRRPLAVIHMKASKNEEGSLHDLNALAKTGILNLHIEDHKEDILHPPFLPVSGIMFGHNIALAMVSALLKSARNKVLVEETCYLLESTQDSLKPFFDDELQKTGETKFLHNGKFPCYCMYRLRDGHYAALAAVEEKFWLAFTKALDLNLGPESRFHYKDKSVFEAISRRLLELSSKELKKKTQSIEMCLNIL